MASTQGCVELVNSRVIEGWIDIRQAGEIALYIDGIELQRQVPRITRVDVTRAGYPGGMGFRFYVAALRLEPGPHTVEIAPIIEDRPQSFLSGVGIDHSAFELTIPHPTFSEPGVIDILRDEYAIKPEIRRLLIADPKINYRPDNWLGDVIFVDGAPNSPSSRYRIFNIQNELVRLGYDCCALLEHELWRVVDGSYSAKAIHFFRCPFSGVFSDAGRAARERGTRISYDIDDLAFDPNVLPYVDGLRKLTYAEIEQYRLGMLEYGSFIKFADFCTTSTAYLARRLQTISPRVSVVVNSIGHSLFSYPYRRSREVSSTVRIGYYPGTGTHQSDFAVAVGALRRVLERFSHVRFRLVGPLDVAEFPDLMRLADSIERFDLMPYSEMLLNMAECDITIAPLECANPYCEAKSELKYFEGALTGSVVVASPTETYSQAIENGRTGFLANSSAEWFDYLCRVIEDPELRADIQQAAKIDARERYHACTATKQFLEAASIAHTVSCSSPALHNGATWSSQPGAPRSCDAGESMDIGFVVPPLLIGSGGHRKVLKLCHDLDQTGHKVTMYILGGRSTAENKELIRRHYYPFAGRIFRYNGAIQSHRFLVATSWETAYVVRRHLDCVGAPVYFVQDFEPMFMPVGSDYLKAFATYTFGYQTICFGRWVAEQLGRELGLSVDIIPFSLDKSTYYPRRDGVAKVKSVLLFARPSQSRRAFELACEALEIVARRLSSVQIGFYGEDTYGIQRFSYINYGLITSGSELADLYRSSTVGVCLSPTNPSMVGYEMMACGMALVDLDLPGSEVNFGGKDIVYFASPTAEAIADQICLALEDDQLRACRVAAGIALTSQMQLDESVALEFAGHLRARLNYQQSSNRPSEDCQGSVVPVAAQCSHPPSMGPVQPTTNGHTFEPMPGPDSVQHAAKDIRIGDPCSTASQGGRGDHSDAPHPARMGPSWAAPDRFKGSTKHSNPKRTLRTRKNLEVTPSTPQKSPK